MKILCIDSTSAKARIAVTDNLSSIYEKALPGYSEKWLKMVQGDTSILVDDFLQLTSDCFDEINISWDDIDYICYSGYSGFQSSMNVGKILTNVLGKIYKKEVICVDHITAHYFSHFVQRKDINEQVFPILFFSASGSHNSFALLKSWKDLYILNDATYFDSISAKHIGIGSIYYKALKYFKIIEEDDFPDVIEEKLGNIKNTSYDQKVVDACLDYYGNTNIFDTNFYTLFTWFKETYISSENMKRNIELFFSFERAIFVIIGQKIDKILQLTPVREISIVGGISNNDSFMTYLESCYGESPIVLSRPKKLYRFDNASMLGVLTYCMKKYDCKYPFSKIIT